MSRIGKQPVTVPAGVDVKIDGHIVTVKGPKGELTREFNPMMTISQRGRGDHRLPVLTTPARPRACTA